MNLPAALPDVTADAPEAAAACPSCPHPLDAHDDIDLRFCRATASGGKTRGCTCSS